MPGPHSRTDLRKFIAFGSGVGIEIAERNLDVTAVRVRPNGIDVLGTTTIADFAARPAAEWGAEYAQFLKQTGGTHLAATVLLPRRETIVRQIALPGVAARDLPAAIALQIDTLHPYGEDDVVHGWSRLENGGVLLGILRRTVLDHYVALFAEAGVAVASFTFSAAAFYTAHRMPVGAHPQMDGDGFVAMATGQNGTVEIYGESAARPVFSADFDLTPERAVALATSELRLDADREPLPLASILPAPRVNPVSNDLSRRALPYATALAGACSWLAAPANLLPPEHRRTNSRAMYVPTAILGIVLIVVAGGFAAHSSIEDRRYLTALESQMAQLEPQAKRAAVLDREALRAQNKSRLLDEFRGRTKADLDALNELTAQLPPPTWTSMIDLTRDAATINGETEQAAPLLKLLDASPYFQNSTFIGSIAKAGGSEQFQIRTAREARR
jgi:Tfp pilus assembly protein PilN